MLSKNQRISRNRLNYLLKKGLKINNSYFLVKYALNKGEQNRYSVIVSKKILKLATDRNHLRRQLYQAISTLNTTCQTCFDTLLTVKSSLIKLKFSEMTKELQQLFDQISFQINQNYGE